MSRQLNLRLKAPHAPGSESSRRAAERMTVAKRTPQWWKVLEALGAVRYGLTREELSRRTGIKETSLCGRLYELAPLYVQVSKLSGISSADVTVDTYRITAAGRARLSEAA
jgi:AraC-like DNA-binding protein